MMQRIRTHYGTEMDDDNLIEENVLFFYKQCIIMLIIRNYSVIQMLLVKL